MIVSEIRYDRVTIHKSDEKITYLGCLVSLKEDKSVNIQSTGDPASGWVNGPSIVMTEYKLLELTPWSMTFDANFAEGHQVRDVRVVCDFNIFSSASTRSGHRKELKGVRFSGNRKCEICGHVKGLSSFHRHDECEDCTDKALQALYAVQEALKGEDGEVNWHLMPSKNAYMKDYLVRMKNSREREEDDEDRKRS